MFQHFDKCRAVNSHIVPYFALVAPPFFRYKKSGQEVLPSGFHFFDITIIAQVDISIQFNFNKVNAFLCQL